MRTSCGARRAADQRDERRRAVEHREAGLDPVVAHRHLAAVDAIVTRDRRRAAGVDAPAVLADLTTARRRRAGAARHDVLDVPLVFADQIRTRRPDRHEQFDLRLPAGRIGRLDFDVVGLRRREAQRVANRLGACARGGRGLAERGVAIARESRHRERRRISVRPHDGRRSHHGIRVGERSALDSPGHDACIGTSQYSAHPLDRPQDRRPAVRPHRARLPARRLPADAADALAAGVADLAAAAGAGARRRAETTRPAASCCRSSTTSSWRCTAR